MVDVRLLHHGAHCMLNRAVSEFVVGVFFPDRFQVEIRAAHEGLEKLEAPCVRYGFCDVVIMLTGGCCKSIAFRRGILVLLGRRSGRSSLSSYMVQCGDLDCREIVEGRCINVGDAGNELGDLGQCWGCFVPEIRLVGCGWSALGRERGKELLLTHQAHVAFWIAS